MATSNYNIIIPAYLVGNWPRIIHIKNIIKMEGLIICGGFLLFLLIGLTLTLPSKKKKPSITYKHKTFEFDLSKQKDLPAWLNVKTKIILIQHVKITHNPTYNNESESYQVNLEPPRNENPYYEPPIYTGMLKHCAFDIWDDHY